MKRIATVLSIAAVSLAVATAAPANAAQGGNDHNGDPHYWIKVGRNEVDNSGASFVGDCRRLNIMTNSRGGSPACDRLVPLLQSELRAHPNANGYWAEWYYNTNRSNAGIW